VISCAIFVLPRHVQLDSTHNVSCGILGISIRPQDWSVSKFFVIGQKVRKRRRNNSYHDRIRSNLEGRLGRSSTFSHLPPYPVCNGSGIVIHPLYPFPFATFTYPLVSSVGPIALYQLKFPGGSLDLRAKVDFGFVSCDSVPFQKKKITMAVLAVVSSYSLQGA
jgi:hypothetical protein